MAEAIIKSPPHQTVIKRILILRWGGVGDFLLTLPAIYSVRKHFPHAHIAIMGSTDTIDLAASKEYADEFLHFDWAISSDWREAREAARLGMMQKLKEFDFIINYHSFGQVDALLDDCGVNYLSFEDKVFLRERKHASEHFCDLLRSIPAASVFSRPKVYLNSEERRFAINFLNHHGLDLRNDCIIAVHVGSGDPQKRWFPDRYRDVISSIVGSGAKVLLLSGPSDDDIVGLVYEGAERDNVFIVRGIPIRKVAAIIERSTLFLGNDSGLMHLASAVGIPIVSLFGPSDPVTWGPIGARNVIVIGNCTRIDLDEEACRSCGFQECLDSIKTEDVIRVVRERLKYLRSFLSANCLGRHLSSRFE
jgi:ADP-heptose:LPS heptosyltransferase